MTAEPGSAQPLGCNRVWRRIPPRHFPKKLKQDRPDSPAFDDENGDPMSVVLAREPDTSLGPSRAHGLPGCRVGRCPAQGAGTDGPSRPRRRRTRPRRRRGPQDRLRKKADGEGGKVEDPASGRVPASRWRATECLISTRRRRQTVVKPCTVGRRRGCEWMSEELFELLDAFEYQTRRPNVDATDRDD